MDIRADLQVKENVTPAELRATPYVPVSQCVAPLSHTRWCDPHCATPSAPLSQCVVLYIATLICGLLLPASGDTTPFLDLPSQSQGSSFTHYIRSSTIHPSTTYPSTPLSVPLTLHHSTFTPQLQCLVCALDTSHLFKIIL